LVLKRTFSFSQSTIRLWATGFFSALMLCTIQEAIRAKEQSNFKTGLAYGLFASLC
jgi:hypothetical protein